MTIYKFLRQRGKAAVATIVEHVGLTQPTVSYHLNEMKNAGILESERDGKEIYYKISDTCKIFHQDCVLKEVKFPA
jgi:ArsR family transcriptional regulator